MMGSVTKISFFLWHTIVILFVVEVLSAQFHLGDVLSIPIEEMGIQKNQDVRDDKDQENNREPTVVSIVINSKVKSCTSSFRFPSHIKSSCKAYVTAFGSKGIIARGFFTGQ